MEGGDQDGEQEEGAAGSPSQPRLGLPVTGLEVLLGPSGESRRVSRAPSFHTRPLPASGSRAASVAVTSECARDTSPSPTSTVDLRAHSSEDPPWGWTNR